MMKGLSNRTGGTPAVGNTGYLLWEEHRKGKRNTPWEGRGPCEVRMIYKTTREMVRSSCLRLIENRMGDKGLRK